MVMDITWISLPGDGLTVKKIPESTGKTKPGGHFFYSKIDPYLYSPHRLFCRGNFNWFCYYYLTPGMP